MSERIDLDLRGEWLRLRVELNFEGGDPNAPLRPAALEELELVSRVISLAGAWQARRAARRTPPTEEVTLPTSDEDLSVALPAEAIAELEEELAELDLDDGTIADALDARDEHADDVDDDQDDEREFCPSPTAAGREDRCGRFSSPPRCNAGACTMTEVAPPATPPAAEVDDETKPSRPTESEVMRACGRLTPIEKLSPAFPLARELGIAAGRVAPYVKMARSRGWLPEMTTTTKKAGA